MIWGEKPGNFERAWRGRGAADCAAVAGTTGFVRGTQMMAGVSELLGRYRCHGDDIPIVSHCKTVFFGFFRGGLRYRGGTFFGWWGSWRRYVWWGFASDHVIDDVTGDVITFFETGLNIQITPWLQRFVLGARISV